MAGQGNNWNDFMQSKPVRIMLNAFCAVICGYYAVGAVFDLVRPSETSLMLIEQVGTLGYYALTVARLVVCLWVAVVFARMTVKTIREEE